MIGLLGRQAAVGGGGHGKPGTKQADWPEDVDVALAAQEQAGYKVICRKSNENKNRGTLSGSLNDSFFQTNLTNFKRHFLNKTLCAKVLRNPFFCHRQVLHYILYIVTFIHFSFIFQSNKF